MGEAEIVVHGWAGRRAIPCEVVGETPKCYRVRMMESAVLPGHRYRRKGDLVLVPKAAIAPKRSTPTPEAHDGE